MFFLIYLWWTGGLETDRNIGATEVDAQPSAAKNNQWRSSSFGSQVEGAEANYLDVKPAWSPYRLY